MPFVPFCEASSFASRRAEHRVIVAEAAGKCATTNPSGAGGTGSHTAAAGKAGALGQAGALADVGPFADGGAASIPPRNPDLPEPPDDSCERFQISEAPCVGTVCPPWPGELVPSANDRWCSPFQRAGRSPRCGVYVRPALRCAIFPRRWQRARICVRRAESVALRPRKSAALVALQRGVIAGTRTSSPRCVVKLVPGRWRAACSRSG